MYIYMYLFIYIRVHMRCICVLACACVCVCHCVYVCFCACVCVSVYCCDLFVCNRWLHSQPLSKNLMDAVGVQVEFQTRIDLQNR